MNGTGTPAARHPIGVVARRTGLKPDLIRAWERRYEAVIPSRSGTRRRFYTDEDIGRLILLRNATREGRAIGQVAHLSDAELRALIAEDQAALVEAGVERAARRRTGTRGAEAEEAMVDRCLAAVERLDGHSLEHELERGSLTLSRVRVVHGVLLPLLDEIGERWSRGTLRPAEEHLASAVARTFLGNLLSSDRSSEVAPTLIAATPVGQRHELGALIAAADADEEGWSTIYLGPDLPAEEIAAATQKTGAAVVALSLIYPPDDPRLPEELLRLGRLLPADVALLVGGRAAAAYDGTLDRIGAVQLEDIAELRPELDHLRSAPVPG